MKKILNNIVNTKKAKLDKNGIWITDFKLSKEVSTSHETWEKIYNFNLAKLKTDRAEFNESKLNDHVSYIEKYYKFTSKSIYLEIGCGPSYIAEYLIKTYNCNFIGVDFNYGMLVTLKNYFDSKGYKNFLLIHADINHLPIKNDTIDFIYGGGVIEHFKNPNIVLKELYRVLQKDGVAFNTVPAFNLFWPVSMKKNIPSFPILKQAFEFFHLNLLKSKLLNKYHGYELSFGKSQLKNIHRQLGFKSTFAGAFAFHPSKKKLKNRHLRNIYYRLSKYSLISPIIYISAKK